MTAGARVVVAMSGGVDSSVAAALLKDQGYDVVGVTLHLWDAQGSDQVGRCCAPEDRDDARRTCEHLGVPHYVIDERAAFRAHVVEPFVATNLAGRTPSPCVACNQQVKLTRLWELARGLGAAALATGHYARVDIDEAGAVRLRRGRDAEKDQSYFLFGVPHAVLRVLRLPLGELTKREAREIARARGLCNWGKPDSQELCFVPDGDVRGFVQRHGGSAEPPGDVVDEDGKVIGRHAGVSGFTVGQRRGLGIPGHQPRHVLRVLPDAAQVVIGPAASLRGRELHAKNAAWTVSPPPRERFLGVVQIRSRHGGAAAEVIPTPDGFDARFTTPQSALAPGQAAVVYQGDRVIGGGYIDSHDTAILARRRERGGAVVEGDVRDVTEAGDSVVETVSGIVFVRGGLPGERVRLRVTGRAAGAARGALLQVVVPSAARRPSPCDLARRCGGCPLIELERPAQEQLKLARVARALRHATLGDAAPRWVSAGPEFGYRRRARLAFRRVGGKVLIGYHAAARGEIVDVPACPVLDPSLAGALSALRDALSPVLQGRGELQLATTLPAGALVQLASELPQPPAAYRAAEALVGRGGVSGVLLRVGGGAPVTFGLVQPRVAGAGRALRASPFGFAQANAEVNERLVQLVVELTEPAGARVLELYAGHGNFSVAVGGPARDLVAYEVDASAAAACRENLRAAGVSHASVVTSDAAHAGEHGPCDVLLLDPPRAGARPLADVVARCRPARVVYVSCDPTTLERDLRALVPRGYRVDRAYALDMFPQTGHVEALVRAVRAPS